ncbi:MAG TPA: hypothetical protein ENH26_01940 [Candidatus Wolfebacteria bacterium]|nr:hypothetical protein [Candidatus Wolfebacteria bacterium]
MKKIIKYLLIGLVSLVIVIGTLSIPKTVYDKEDMGAMKFGYPIAFVTQDLTRYDPPFPWKWSFSSPWENPSDISWFNFLFSYLIIFLITGFVVIETERLFLKSRKSDIR